MGDVIDLDEARRAAQVAAGDLVEVEVGQGGGPPHGAQVWISDCCLDIRFYLTVEGVHCWGCGKTQRFR